MQILGVSKGWEDVAAQLRIGSEKLLHGQLPITVVAQLLVKEFFPDAWLVVQKNPDREIVGGYPIEILIFVSATDRRVLFQRGYKGGTLGNLPSDIFHALHDGERTNVYLCKQALDVARRELLAACMQEQDISTSCAWLAVAGSEYADLIDQLTPVEATPSYDAQGRPIIHFRVGGKHSSDSLSVYFDGTVSRGLLTDG
jgi:hypothetical protein